MTRGVRRIAAASLLAWPIAAAGEIVELGFAGSITSTFGTIDATPAASFVGQRFVGGFVYDTEASDLAPGFENSGLYAFSVPPHSFWADLGSLHFSVPAGFQIQVENESGFGGDFYWVRTSASFPFPEAPGQHISYFQLESYDQEGDILSDDALPTGPLPLALFAEPMDRIRFNVQGCADANFNGSSCTTFDFIVDGPITAFTVPEPAHCGAPALVALLWVSAAWRRRSLVRPQLRRGRVGRRVRDEARR